MRRAIDYAHLIGKYVRMECDNLSDPTTIDGMEALVVGVWDMTGVNGRRSMVIAGDEGMGCTITEDREDDWHIAVFDTEKHLRSYEKWGRVPQTFGAAQKLTRRTLHDD